MFVRFDTAYPLYKKPYVPAIKSTFSFDFFELVKKLETPNQQQALSAELLGKIIKARRTQSDLRLEDAAALCGVAKDTLMKIEHGQSACQLGRVLQICSALGIKLYVAPWTDSNESENDWS